MIVEIDSSELIVCLMQKTNVHDLTISYSKLREIGNKIEYYDHELVVNLNDRSINNFCSNSKANFNYHDNNIEIKGVQTISVQRIVRRFQPSRRVFKLIEEILENE